MAAIIALFGVVITGAINTYISNKDQAAQRKLQAANAESQQKLEQNKAQETALQKYLSDIGDLILDDSSPLRDATAGGEASRLARAKTLAVLQGLNGDRKRILLQFLKEEELINTPSPIVELAGADLSYAQLSGLDKDRNRFLLGRIHLVAVNLYRADMKFSELSRADLSQSDLTETNLEASDLSETNLQNAILQDATLPYADLSSVNLEGVNLRGALLRNAHLNGAVGLSADQLAQQGTFLEGATMPNGQKYEDWLKDREGCAKNGENSGPS